MADHAPGSGPATKEPSCINCGGVGHWAVACPEPVRARPAGLPRRSTSNSHEHGRGSDHQHGGRRSGAVVTKYPAPPTANPLVTRYGPPPAQVPRPPQPYPSYPPPSAGYAPPPPGSYPGYPQYSPPPPPFPPPGAYPPPPGPPGPSAPYHYPSPGQYGGPPTGPPVPPPPSYQPPPPYPPNASYPPSYTPPSGYQPASAPPPPPLPPSGQYSAPYNPISSEGYSPSTYGLPPAPPPYGVQPGPPPPPPSYAQPYGPPAPGYGPSPPLPTPPRGTPPGLPPIPPHRNQLSRDRHGRHRQGHNHRPDRPRKNNKHGNNPKRDAPQSRPKSDGNKEKHEPARVVPEPKTLKTASVASVTTPKGRHDNSASEESIDDDEVDWKWEAEMIFNETNNAHQPDPIAKPLPGPDDYHDNIMLPPAWNATCMLSDFVTEENLEEFSRPIRETKYFASLQLDPVFWKGPVDSKAARQEPEPRDNKPASFKSIRLPGFPSLPPKPPTPENREYRLVNSRKRTWEDAPYKTSRTRSSQDGDWTDHRQKRHRGDSHSGYDTTSPHNRRIREDSRPIDRYRSQRPDCDESDPTEALLKSLDDSHDVGPSRRHGGGEKPGTTRHEFDRNSSRDARRQGSASSFHEGRTPPLLGTPPPEDNAQQKQTSRSRSRSRHSHRPGSRSSHAESRPASRQSAASFASHGTEDSELSALEAELLGIAPKSKGAKESKHGGHGSKFRKRVPKVDSAYGRRW